MVLYTIKHLQALRVGFPRNNICLRLLIHIACLYSPSLNLYYSELVDWYVPERYGHSDRSQILASVTILN